MRLRLTATLLAFAPACAPSGVPTIGVFGRQLHYPMYYAVSDGTEGGGRIYRVDEASVGQAVGSEEMTTGLSFPGALAVDHFGNVLVTETRSAPDGALKLVRRGETEPRAVAIELDYPTGLVVDSFQQRYVAENGRHRIARLAQGGGLVAFGASLSSPEHLAIGEDDSIVVTEGETGVVRIFAADGTLTAQTPKVEGLSSIAIDAAGAVHVLVLDTTTGTGGVLRFDADGGASEVLMGLVNPTAMAFDGENALYVAEGAPANRISRLEPGASARRVIIQTSGEPQAIAFTSF